MLTTDQVHYYMARSILIFVLVAVIGSLIANYLANRYGRKRALIIGHILGFLGGLCFLMIKWTNAIELFFLGKILVGKIVFPVNRLSLIKNGGPSIVFE